MTLDVAHAQYAGGGPGYALVRLSGRARATTAPPTLLIADGAAWRRLAPVPGTPVVRSGAPFSVAFEVPLHLALGDGAWWLEPGPVLSDASVRARVEQLSARVAALGDEVAALRARVEGQGDEDGTRAELPPPSEDAAGAPAGEPPAGAAPAGDTAPSGPGADASPIPRAARLRALRPGLPAVIFAAGAIAAGDAVATVVWQEPVSALWAAREQHALNGDLQRLDAAYATPQAAEVAGAGSATVTSPQQRMQAMARTLDTRTSAGKPLGELRISRLHAKYVVVQGTRTSSLRKGPGHYAGTALPGQPGTVGIAGHRTTYGAPFRHIDALRRGDSITISMPYGRFTYRVEGQRIVTPEDVSALQAVGRQRLVLTACHPLYSAAKRLVVIAQLQTATPRGAAAPGTTA